MGPSGVASWAVGEGRPGPKVASTSGAVALGQAVSPARDEAFMIADPAAGLTRAVAGADVCSVIDPVSRPSKGAPRADEGGPTASHDNGSTSDESSLLMGCESGTILAKDEEGSEGASGSGDMHGLGMTVAPACVTINPLGVDGRRRSGGPCRSSSNGGSPAGPVGLQD